MTYSIPPGFLTDMGSIPRIARMTVDRMGKSLPAFIIHDYLYTNYSPVSRKTADKVLYQISRAGGESWYTANKIYYAVRAGGWAADKVPNEYVDISYNVIKKIVTDNFTERKFMKLKKDWYDK